MKKNTTYELVANLQRWLQLPESPDYQGVQKLLARWQPYGGLIVCAYTPETLMTIFDVETKGNPVD